MQTNVSKQVGHPIIITTKFFVRLSLKGGQLINYQLFPKELPNNLLKGEIKSNR